MDIAYCGFAIYRIFFINFFTRWNDREIILTAIYLMRCCEKIICCSNEHNSVFKILLSLILFELILWIWKSVSIRVRLLPRVRNCKQQQFRVDDCARWLRNNRVAGLAVFFGAAKIPRGMHAVHYVQPCNVYIYNQSFDHPCKISTNRNNNWRSCHWKNNIYLVNRRQFFMLCLCFLILLYTYIYFFFRAALRTQVTALRRDVTTRCSFSPLLPLSSSFLPIGSEDLVSHGIPTYIGLLCILHTTKKIVSIPFTHPPRPVV